jgi:hypothetical protein
MKDLLTHEETFRLRVGLPTVGCRAAGTGESEQTEKKS